MTASLQHLLAGIFDYAGLFPPASLEMSSAAINYRRYLSGPENWVTNRFVCPIGRLEELLPHLPDGEPWGIACIGTSVSAYRADLSLIEAFEDKAQGRAIVECYEAKADGPLDKGILKGLANVGYDDCFIELPWDDVLLDNLTAVAETEALGAKARTGGVQASAYPSCDELAAFLQECLNLDLPMKLTAGLHHPFRFHDQTVNTKSHGFLNVLCAGALAGDHDLSRSEISEILADENKGSFRFSVDCFVWNNLESELEAIDDFRELFSAIGSCSIEDPLSDLRSLGLGDAAVTQ